MAYVLGFFTADGNLIVNKRGASFWSIEICDRDILEKIRKALSSEHKISVRKKKGLHNAGYRLQIGSKEIYSDLRSLGFKTHKTFSLTLPFVPDAYFPDFVRGYFDGDGNVWSGFVLKKGRRVRTLILQVVFTSCSHQFLYSLQKRLETYGITGGLHKHKTGNYSRLVYSVRSSQSLYLLLYKKKNVNLYLYRKYRIFQRFFCARIKKCGRGVAWQHNPLSRDRSRVQIPSAAH